MDVPASTALSTSQTSETLKICLLDDSVRMPSRSYDSDTGIDFFAPAKIYLPPYTQVSIPTRITMSIPHGQVGIIHTRSGHALRGGVSVLGGVIDSGFDGEVLVMHMAMSDSPYSIDCGIAFAQFLIYNFSTAIPKNRSLA